MSWNGSGTYTLPALYSPEVNGTVIDATRYNGLTSDVAAGINNCLAKDGQNVPTANLPMGGFKHTGLSEPAAAGQALLYNQAGLASILGNLRVGHASLTGVRAMIASASGDVGSASYRTGTTMAVFRSSAAGVAAGAAIVSGNAATAYLALGDTDDAAKGGIDYNNATETLSLRTDGANRVTLTSTLAQFDPAISVDAKSFVQSDDSVVITDNGVAIANVIATYKYEQGLGVGATVTQLTSKATAVTINRPTGEIVLNASNLAAGAVATFTVNNTRCFAETVPLLAVSGGTAGAYVVTPGIGTAGGFNISIRNVTAGALAESFAIQFVLIGGAKT